MNNYGQSIIKINIKYTPYNKDGNSKFFFNL